MDAATLGTGPSYWQVGAALVAVLGLLVVLLKGLQRWQGASQQSADAQLLSVRRLGPRRELQILRVGEQVHTIYRHESAMVLLETASSADHEAARPEPAAAQPSLPRRLMTLVAAAGGASRRASP